MILITGCAGFIGYHLSSFYLKKGFKVMGLDNLNDYYDINFGGTYCLTEKELKYYK